MSKKTEIENAVKGLTPAEVTESLLSSSPAETTEREELERELRAKITAEVRAELGAESKTARVNFLLRPSIYQKLKERATHDGVSLNEEVNRLFTRVLNE